MSEDNLSCKLENKIESIIDRIGSLTKGKICAKVSFFSSFFRKLLQIIITFLWQNKLKCGVKKFQNLI